MKTAIAAVLTLVIAFVNAQTHLSAIAFPLEDIEVDGNLQDWPEDVMKYALKEVVFGKAESVADLSASFSVAYSSSLEELYVSVQVTDNEHFNEGEDINLVDRLLLYIDPIHNAHLGSSIILEVGEKHKAISRKPAAWNPLLGSLGWEEVNVAVSRDSIITTYEWSLKLSGFIKENNVLGLDLIIADKDSSEEDSAWLLWKPGTGKSETGFRLGEVILAGAKEKIGVLSGKVGGDISASQLKIQSLDHDRLWCRASVDSSGFFTAQLPYSSYVIEPFIPFSSPIFSDGFNQKSRKLTFTKSTKIHLQNKKIAFEQDLLLREIPIPTGLLRDRGILFSEKIDETLIDSFLRTYADYFQIPGVSIALIKDKNVVFDKTYGVKNNLTQEPLETTSLFEAASITKPMFSMMVLKMAENGEIDLDKPLHEYLAFPNLEADTSYTTMTARHVLNHRSGLDNWPLGSYSGNIPDYPVRLNFSPGEKYGYSGEAMNYLGRVVEKINSKPLHVLFEQEIKSTFNLQNTYLRFSEDLEESMALGHYHDTPFYKYKYNNVNSPASSMVSGANDFAKVIIGLMNRQYLSPESYDLIYNIHKEMGNDQKLYDTHFPQGIGYGFFVTESSVGKIVAHGGNNGDYDCLFMMIPEKEIGFIVFTNSNLGDEFNRLLSLFLIQGKTTEIDF